jgi:hypothetical protein
MQKRSEKASILCYTYISYLVTVTKAFDNSAPLVVPSQREI